MIGRRSGGPPLHPLPRLPCLLAPPFSTPDPLRVDWLNCGLLFPKGKCALCRLSSD